jgi:hypothetical protein
MNPTDSRCKASLSSSSSSTAMLLLLGLGLGFGLGNWDDVVGFCEERRLSDSSLCSVSLSLL